MIYRCIAEIALFVLSMLLIYTSFVLALSRRRQAMWGFVVWAILTILAALHVGRLFP